MKMRLLLLLAVVAGLLPMTGQTADPKPQEGWYPQLVQADFVKNYAVLPKVDGVMIIDSRPAGACSRAARASTDPATGTRRPCSGT